MKASKRIHMDSQLRGLFHMVERRVAETGRRCRVSTDGERIWAYIDDNRIDFESIEELEQKLERYR